MEDGLLLIDKPEGWTSHDVVAYLRQKLGVRKIGHAGTLDPFATGLLIVGVGPATKRLGEFLKMDKSYEATIRLGASSDTDDRTGTITPTKPPPVEQREETVREALARFVGTIDQIPPAYSAKKIHGKKMYELARRGIAVERKPATVTIHSIDLLDYQWPLVKIRTSVSSGTYIRALSRDLGEALGVGAYLEELRRISIGDFKVENAESLTKNSARDTV